MNTKAQILCSMSHTILSSRLWKTSTSFADNQRKRTATATTVLLVEKTYCKQNDIFSPYRTRTLSFLRRYSCRILLFADLYSHTRLKTPHNILNNWVAVAISQMLIGRMSMSAQKGDSAWSRVADKKSLGTASFLENSTYLQLLLFQKYTHNKNFPKLPNPGTLAQRSFKK